MELLIENIENNLTYLGTSANPYLVLKQCTSSVSEGTVAINDNTEIISENAFENISVGTLVLPSSLKQVGKDAFKNSTIGTLRYQNITSNWCNIEFENYFANPITATATHQIALYSGTFGNNITIYSDVNPYCFASYHADTVSFANEASDALIKKDAFLNAQINTTQVSNISIWYTLNFESMYSNPTYYSRNLYYNNSPVTSVTLNSTIVHDYAFVNIPLNEVIVNSNVRLIGHQAFFGCPDSIYTRVNGVAYLGNSNNKVLMFIYDKNSFVAGTGYIGVNIDLDTDIPGYLDTDKTILACYNGTLANSTRFILNNACKNSNISGLGNLSNLVFIGTSAFENCNNLNTGVTIPNGVIMIGEHAFQNSAITAIQFNTNLTEIPANICNSCNKLKQVTFSNTITTVKEKAFAYCSQLETVLLNSGLVHIKDQAFLQCKKLSSNFNTPLIIPVTVKYIGEQAFFGCDGIKRLIFYVIIQLLSRLTVLAVVLA